MRSEPMTEAAARENHRWASVATMSLCQAHLRGDPEARRERVLASLSIPSECPRFICGVSYAQFTLPTLRRAAARGKELVARKAADPFNNPTMACFDECMRNNAHLVKGQQS